MPYINNPGTAPGNRRKLILVVIGVVCFVLFSAWVMYSVLTRNDSGGNKTDTGSYYDPGSRETVSDPPGKTPENFGGDSKEPIYLGFSKLLGSGLTNYQLSALKKGLFDYSIVKNLGIKELSIDIDSVEFAPRSRENPSEVETLYFDLTIDRKEKHKVQLDYTGLSTVRFNIYKNGTVIYDSQNIDGAPTEDSAD